MNLEVLLPDEQRYDRFRAKHSEFGHVEMAECDICGNLQWCCTRTKDPIGYSVLRLQSCDKCQEVFTRAPEIFTWAISAILKAQKDMKAKP